MKAHLDAIIQREQAQYLDKLLVFDDPLILEMESYAAEHRVPIADREVARFIEITARVTGAKKALEIGMAIGYTVLHLARAIGEDGTIVTIEPNDEMIRASSGYLDRAGVMSQVKIERGKALEVLPTLHETFDLLFIDALKEEYKGYLVLALPLMKRGGVIIVDNLLWGGKVAQKTSDDEDASTTALREFNTYFMTHPQLSAAVLPVGDGLGYAVKN